MPGEHRWRDVLSSDGPFAELSCPAHPSIAEHNPATVAWRAVLLDPDLAGLAPARPRVTRLAIVDGAGRRWQPTLSGVLATRLAWHPELPLVAGLLVRDRRAYPWVADYRERTVTVYDRVQAALSVRAPGRAPLLWCGGTRLVLTVPAVAHPARVVDRVPRQVVLEAAGPGRVALLPGPDVLESVAAARIAVFDLEENRTQDVSEAMLVSDVQVVGGKLRVDHLASDTDDGHGGPPDFGLRHEVSYVDIGDAASAPAGTVVDVGAAPPPAPLSIPVHGGARLSYHAESGRAGPVVLWIHAAEPGGTPLGQPPPTLVDSGYPVAVLNLPIDWPADATADLVSGQVTAAVRAAAGLLAERHPGPVVVGGHSFGATLALHALSHIAGLSAAIVHSGCYNRTLTPYGFHREQRSYWQAPDVYQAFSATHNADRLTGPVLVVHGADDLNPATPSAQAVQFYQAVVAAGGRARLVLLPHEGHNFWYRENLCFLTDEHAAWLAKWTDRKGRGR